MRNKEKSRKTALGILLGITTVFLAVIAITGCRERQITGTNVTESEPAITEEITEEANDTKYSLNDPAEKLKKDHSVVYETDTFKMNQMEDLFDEINDEEN